MLTVAHKVARSAVTPVAARALTEGGPMVVKVVVPPATSPRTLDPTIRKKYKVEGARPDIERAIGVSLAEAPRVVRAVSNVSWLELVPYLKKPTEVKPFGCTVPFRVADEALIPVASVVFTLGGKPTGAVDVIRVAPDKSPPLLPPELESVMMLPDASSMR